MKILAFVLLMLFFSCSSSKNSALKKVVYMPHKHRGKISLIIPKRYIKYEIVGGPGEYYEHTYSYSDSSLIYITSRNGGGPNHSNIVSQGHFSNLSFAENKEKPDTLLFQGIDINGLFWKHLLLNGVGIGYVRVPKEKKELYDKALSTIKYKL